MGLERLFTVLNVAASGLAAQRQQLDAAASNIANAETLETPEGGPYRRRDVVFRQTGVEKFSTLVQRELARLGPVGERIMAARARLLGHRSPAVAVEAKEVRESSDQGQLVYDPGHPLADAEGYVRKPNVNMVKEMLSLMTATRAYEANLSVVQATKTMAKKALEI
ncbi:MAG: flagellar basal body rod protein FlgC [candidate division KSB1 bacterium]|nr:flagellar basal body rod protein FlgC [candidate division KSB1 bacterium]MDZ7385524.1 flagellar basal body rod protein FlgC [candidate division KSB1 bacterium]MDZ7392631.1 flagellar basal body rod protein FlgC [candidate division KSB1 bacterium]MDZ7412975.1 flagellar basal body rod protein FlgC [candidate division KSB1 bacterium]